MEKKYFPKQIQLDGVFMSSLQELLNLVQLPEYQHANLLIEIKSEPDILDKDRKNNQCFSKANKRC